MSLCFTAKLQDSLQRIEVLDHHRLVVHPGNLPRSLANSDELVEIYGRHKWQIVDLLNEHYSEILFEPFDLYHWLNHNPGDEVAYFLNEAGSNCLNYSELKVPHQFHLWLGRKGFVIGIEQLGKGFDAEKVAELNLKENEGSGFSFFRDCKSRIFFDDKNNTKMVLMEFLF